jgi:hypothetical protein
MKNSEARTVQVMAATLVAVSTRNLKPIGPPG